MTSAEGRRPVHILELRSVRGTGGGPEKTILVGSARSDPARFPVTVCYIRDLRDDTFEMRSHATKLGVDYVEIVERHSFDPAIWPKLVRLIGDRRIDIVHAHDYKTDFLALLLALRRGVIPLATVHGWIRNTWRERGYYVADRWLLTRFPAVIAVSGPIRDTLVAKGARPDRVHRIPNGIDHAFFRRYPEVRGRIRNKLGLPAEALTIGAVGRLEPEKRFDLLLEVATAFRSDALHVLLVGDGKLRAALAERVASLGLTDRFHLLGQRSDVRDLLHAIDVYVQTSDTEGVPNAVLEAMAMEVPVVATNVGGTSELMDDGVHGLLVPRGDVAALVEAIRATATDVDSTVRRVAAARRRVEGELSFEVRMRRVEAIYVDLSARFQVGERVAS